MPESTLTLLYALHRVDERLLDLQSQANNLDTGQKELAQAKTEQKALEALTAQRDQAKAKLHELEETARQRRAHAEKQEKELYDGKVDARQISAVQIDIEHSRELADKATSEAEPLRAEVAELTTQVEAATTALDEIKKAILRKRKKAQAVHVEIEAAFKEAQGHRAPRASVIPADVLAKYNAIRKRTGGTAMAVLTPNQTCGTCGMSVAERLRDAIHRDQITTCESCQRILIFPLSDSLLS